VLNRSQIKGIEGDDFLFVQFETKRNTAIYLVKDKSEVRDVSNNKLYQWIADNGKVQFPVTDFSDTAKWTGFDCVGGSVAARPGPRVPGKTLGNCTTANSDFALAA